MLCRAGFWFLCTCAFFTSSSLALHFLFTGASLALYTLNFSPGVRAQNLQKPCNSLSRSASMTSQYNNKAGDGPSCKRSGKPATCTSNFLLPAILLGHWRRRVTWRERCSPIGGAPTSGIMDNILQTLLVAASQGHGVVCCGLYPGHCGDWWRHNPSLRFLSTPSGYRPGFKKTADSVLE